MLSDADLLSRWKRSTVSSGEYLLPPQRPESAMAYSVMYVWVAARFYFLLGFVDAPSAIIAPAKLLISLDGQSVAVELRTGA